MLTMSEIKKKIVANRLPIPMFILDELEERDEALAEAQQTIARHKEALQIAMSQNQNPEVFRSVQKLIGETQP